MMAAADVPIVERYKLFQEAANTATKLDWLNIVTIKNVQRTRIEHYGQDIPTWAEVLRTWGEAGTVKWGKNGKLGDRGITMMFVGYANNHARDVYRMLNPSTWRITQTRDIIWLNRMFSVTPIIATNTSISKVTVPLVEGKSSK